MFAVAQNEPTTNLLKSLSQMKRDFPELRFLEHTEDGDNYQDGYTTDGISVYFTFKDDVVVTECIRVCSNNDFAWDWYRKMKKEMPRGIYSVYNEYDVHQLYTLFSGHLLYSADGSKCHCSLYYIVKGWGNGIDGMAFEKGFKK